MPAPSPLAEFVHMLRLLGEFRAHTPIDRVIGDDLQMLTTESVVIGLRSPWVRRVALPVLKAHLALDRDDGTRRSRGEAALEILKRCNDPQLVKTCAAYIALNYLTPEVQQAGEVDGPPRLPLEGEY